MTFYEESANQKAVVTYCRVYGLPIHSIENEGKKTPQAGARAKEMGKLAGVPDLFLPIMRDGFGGLYVEMKAKKGKLSDAQKEVIPVLRKNGYRVEVCHCAQEAIDVIENYLHTKKKGTVL